MTLVSGADMTLVSGEDKTLGGEDARMLSTLEVGDIDKGLSTLEDVLLCILSSEKDDLWVRRVGDVGTDGSDLIGDVGGDVAEVVERVRVLLGVPSYCSRGI